MPGLRGPGSSVSGRARCPSLSFSPGHSASHLRPPSPSHPKASLLGAVGLRFPPDRVMGAGRPQDLAAGSRAWARRVWPSDGAGRPGSVSQPLAAELCSRKAASGSSRSPAPTLRAGPESPSPSLGTGPAGPFHLQSSAECGLRDVSGPRWVAGLRSRWGR